MARGGHRVLSAGTKAKISASLRGNKNAYRGGPKKRLTSREKVANINARTKQNKVNLSDAQIRQRSAVAKRLRARARIEEANGNPLNSKGIPKPSTIEKRDVEVKENVARAKNKVPGLEQKFTRNGTGKQQASSTTAARAAKARGQNGAMTMGHYNATRQRLIGAEKSGRISSEQRKNAVGELNNRINARISRNTAKRIAEMQNGKGSFSKKETVNPDSGLTRSQELAEAALTRKLDKKLADRTPNSKDVDPRVKSTAKPRPLPKASGTPEESVRRAYNQILKDSGRGAKGNDMVGLVELRPMLGHMSRAEQDATLKSMSRGRILDIWQEDNRKALTQPDHDAALRLGGEDNHLISFRGVEAQLRGKRIT
jgi:hypothetical protein